MPNGDKLKRLSKIAREFNVGIHTIVEFLQKKGVEIESSPNTKITPEVYSILLKEYSTDIRLKEESAKLEIGKNRGKQESISIETDEKEQNQEKVEKEEEVKEIKTEVEKFEGPTILGKIDLSDNKPSKKQEPKTPDSKAQKPTTKEEKKPVDVEKEVEEIVEEKTQPLTKEKSEEIKTKIEQVEGPTVVGKIDLSSLNQKTRPSRKTKEEKAKERQDREKGKKNIKSGNAEIKQRPGEKKEDFIKRKAKKLSGPTVVGKIDLPKQNKKDGPVASSSDTDLNRKKKRKRIKKERVDVTSNANQDNGNKKNKFANKKGQKRKNIKQEVKEEDVQKQIKDTLARLTSTKGKNKGAKHRRDKRELVSQKAEADLAKIEAEKNIIKVTEFVSVNELANMMDVQVNEVIATCMALGLFVSINQRLDAETMSLVADEFGYKVEFVSAEVLDAISEEEDDEKDLLPCPPIVTVMGHVDHGKTSLLDYIRKANVIEGEAGGITQHIGAYSVTLGDGKKITFLDTPGHEAFTAMRARGAQVTDVVIIIVAADDSIMPQTVEAINHAQAANVPIVFAINKIDKPGANPDKIKEGLANMNMLVEEWGGKYQSQDISAKNGVNIDALLEKVILEAEMLDLKANPNKKATGTVIEATLDKGRGYVTTILVQAGTLKIGDIILAGNHTGRVKAMFNEKNEEITEAKPSTPVLVLGLNGAAQAGDKFNILDSDREAKEIANRRLQLAREQGLRTQKHITLDEIGRRIAVGNFQELNVIVKGDVDGSIEALSDSLIKLSTGEIQVNVKHKAVGQISESDVLLAAATDAIIIGFQVRPSLAARRLAEKEEVDVRLYSVIYDAINEIKDAMEGMLSPDIKEEIVATVEVKETFKITKVGTIAGCFVREGKIKRSSKIRVIRDGIVVYTGTLGSLKRFKDDVKEVVAGYECGLNIDKFNDIKVDDIVEAYEEVEVKRTL
jgi:translation initiation factor IF-2